MANHFTKTALLLFFLFAGNLYAHNGKTQSSGLEIFLLLVSIISTFVAIAIYNRLKEQKKNNSEITLSSVKDQNEILKLKDAYETLQIEFEKLQETSKIKDSYLANVSHEIRTPIGAVIGMSTLALQTKLDAAQHGYISKIYNSANLLHGLINQILDFSKIEAGEMKLEELEFDINTIFENLSDIVSFASNEKNIDIIFDVDYNTPIKLIGDPLRINQVLINLVMNALKFTHQGEISICVKELPSKEDSVTLEFIVKDTGIGIKEENLEKLFDAFSQAEDETSRIYGGTGLGLNISKQLIEQMGGEIKVESVYGEGTSFIFKINVAQSEKEELRKYRLLSKESMDKKILIIDSSETSLNALHKKLAYFHFFIVDTSSWSEAQSAIKEQSHKFDIIFINAKSFSKNDAIEMLKHLAEEPSKIVFITYDLGRLSHDDIKKIDEPIFLERPYSQQRLYEIILEIEKGDQQKKKETSRLPKDSLKVIRGSKIILAEDNVINQSIVNGMLENTGINIDIANNGEEVLALLKNGDYDLVLMDIHMPIKDGYATTKAIRELNNPIPIVALSASVSEADIKHSLDAGMNAHIGKPICVEELYDSLVKYIST